MKPSLIFLLILFLILVFGSLIFFSRISSQTPLVLIKNNEGLRAKFFIEVADTIAKRAQGLSGRRDLVEDNGMLFIFPEAQQQNFWMKDMKFPLDVIWINEDRIVGFSENVSIPSGDHIPFMNSSEPVDLVLEINAGLVQKLDIKVGDQVEVRR